MQWCVSFPEEHVLIVRPSLIAICAGQHSAAKLLSVLLYRSSIYEQSQPDGGRVSGASTISGTALTQNAAPRIYRTQAQLVADMCGELSEKTLHDVALPTLQLLGYVTVDESGVIYRYTLCLANIHAALAAYQQGTPQLKKILARQAQLERFLIELPFEKLLMNKKDFRCALEKVLLTNRNLSDNKRGPKPRHEADSGTFLASPKNQREIQEKRGEKATAISLPQYRPANGTARTAERNKAHIATPSVQRTNLSASAPSPDQTQAKREGHDTVRRQIDGTSGTRHAETAPQLTSRGQQVLAWYEAIRQVKVRPTVENIRASNGLGEMEEVTRDNLEAVMTLLDHDPWLHARNLVVDLQELESPSSKFRFERILLAIQRRRARSQLQETSPGAGSSPMALTALPDYTHTRPDDLYIRA